MIKKIFISHPKSVGETYFEHFKFAFCCGTKLFLAGLACIIHSFIPYLFPVTASRTIEAVKKDIDRRKNS